MPSMYEDVAEFHIKILGQTVEPASPSLVGSSFQLERYRFMVEELEEYYNSARAGDIVGATDGLLDLIYVALGTLHLMGVPVQECWRAVQEANMRKVRGRTKRGNEFDAAKPPGWIGPEQAIAAALGKAIDPQDNA